VSSQQTPEQEFKLRLDGLDRDARAAARIAYTSRTIHFMASQRSSLVELLDYRFSFILALLTFQRDMCAQRVPELSTTASENDASK
jgi:hypothetical protein